MKRLYSKLVFLIILGFIAIFFGKEIYAYGSRWINFSFCDRPIKYKVVRIDPQFNMTKDQLITEVDKAGKVWGGVVDKDLFEYDEGGFLKINLVYDDRQDILRAINDLNKEVAIEKELIDNKSTDYAQQQSLMEKELKDLNDAIDYWNDKGGAPRDVYSDLVNRQSRLKKEIEKLNQTANNINNKVTEVNQEIHDLNQKVTNFNSIIKVSPEMGLYTSGVNQIDIFFFGDNEELTHVLSHELGHALGLQHTEEKNALMNPITSSSSAPTQADITAITNLCNNKNRIDLLVSDFQNLSYSLMSKAYFLLQNFK